MITIKYAYYNFILKTNHNNLNQIVTKSYYNISTKIYKLNPKQNRQQQQQQQKADKKRSRTSDSKQGYKLVFTDESGTTMDLSHEDFEAFKN